MKIAIVGAGISGLGAALALSERHDVRIYEQAGRLGGHANTVEAAFPDGMQPVDTGFIVYNQRNYPNLCGLFAHLDVPTKWSDMSFGFSLGGGACEYACDNLDKVFAQRWRVFDPRFIRMTREILRFTRVGQADLAGGRANDLALGEWLESRRFSPWFRERFLLPMGGAIWSTSVARMLDFPARNFLNFFCNHDLMTGLDPAQRWRTVDGGSREYVRRVHARLGPRVQLGRAAARVESAGARPRIRFADGTAERFDQVVLAVHGPEARRLLARPDAQQARLLGSFRTTENRAVLHSDTRLMPRRRRVWSSWNFLADRHEAEGTRPAQVTYWMNRLQGIPEHRPLFVSLNPRDEIDPALTHGVYDYAHPFFDLAAFEAQRGMDAIQGRGGVWYAGAWLGYGFHEDGLRAGLRVADALGARPAWAADPGPPMVAADAA
ncbi:NAD(P)/FAD-dependent oxidoreductase [Paralimibaculum aggregatum]|uniref:NAD(P)/FAD-dependent oxidoreductase n=1 Tax=Paralimibaculum aggregatum TaxID=3036245 RepID=A0ABQ6LNC5_9RHOB|nr:FAD-dependent oxidoreductase [Limibaculum sp. NKW23]GMG84724.1 NAD(P)/FAD-dependent oxidoreductase [Limibaculum sp. NKW23]